MKKFVYFIVLILHGSCINEPYNNIPCTCKFNTLQDSLKQYGIWMFSSIPINYIWKGEYDSTQVDCSEWNISIGIDSCNGVFFDEGFVINLANLVFNEPQNDSIRKVNFELRQCHYGQGERKLLYEISRDKLNNYNSGRLYESKFAKIKSQISEQIISQSNTKRLTLLVDSLPFDPYSLALDFAIKNDQYQQVELVVENLNSPICKRVEFLYGFENRR